MAQAILGGNMDSNLKKLSMQVNLLVHAVIVTLWCGWYVYIYGWSSGGHHFLIPLLMLIFFSVLLRFACTAFAIAANVRLLSDTVSSSVLS